MRHGGGGLILNISSTVTKMAIPGIGTYASTKSALNMLSATARGELAPENIRVITVYPGQTATDFGKNARVSQQQGAGRQEPYTRVHPLIRLNTSPRRF